MSVFYLRREIGSLRVDFMLRLLSLRFEPWKSLGDELYLLKRLESYNYKRKQKLNYFEGVQQIWNELRLFLLQNLEQTLRVAEAIEFDSYLASIVLMKWSNLQQRGYLLPLFDMLFDLE